MCHPNPPSPPQKKKKKRCWKVLGICSFRFFFTCHQGAEIQHGTWKMTISKAGFISSSKGAIFRFQPLVFGYQTPFMVGVPLGWTEPCDLRFPQIPMEKVTITCKGHHRNLTAAVFTCENHPKLKKEKTHLNQLNLHDLGVQNNKMLVCFFFRGEG